MVILNAVNAPKIRPDLSTLQVILHPNIWSMVLYGVIGVISALSDRRFWRVFQVGSLLVLGYSIVLYNEGIDELISFYFIAFALFLAWEYNSLRPYPRLKLTVLVATYAVLIVIKKLVILEEPATRAVSMIAGVLVLAWITWTLIGSRLRAELSRNAELEAAVRERTADLQARTEEAEALRDELRVALDEQKTLLAEIHHRTKNNLQLVSSMLELEADTRLVNVDQATLDAARQRVKALATVHDKLYYSSRPGEVDVAAYLQAYAEEIATIAQTYRARLDAQFAGPVAMETDRAIRLAVAVNELVMNALEHAATSSREVVVSMDLSTDDDRLTVSVKDDGPGLPDADDRARYGITLVEQLAAQLKGEAQHINNGGTHWTIMVPLVEPAADPRV